MDLQNALTEIGFTEYEARVYLALLAENPANGYQISKKSGVPRSMVYETLSRLHARGMVLDTTEERATFYRPLPPDVFLAIHTSQHQQLVSGLHAGLNALYHRPPDLEHLWTISGHQNVQGYAAQMINGAQENIYLVVGDTDLELLFDHINAACARGIDANTVLTGVSKLGCGQVVRHPPLESEIQGLIGTLLVVVDDQEMLIAGGENDSLATITRNPNLVLIARQFVWMELFAQRIYARLGSELMEKLDQDDRRIFESLTDSDL